MCLPVTDIYMCVAVYRIFDKTNENVISSTANKCFFFSIQYENSIGKNSAQTDEEKQRERQRNERELKHAELEAQHLKVRLTILSPSIYEQ